ncbi:fimbrial protein [Vibrio sp. 10N.286.49.C2]|uniref:type 4a pilus biogenesis protein PilO n=1 Tax=unclassified Vibrio TaxID=2614977 RepID=UPI000CA9B955|nr:MULTISPECIES: type 4a pilus biogenesis protein PilO [unclassified Vibrio]PMH37904.1 fimbrial protein [Vibrio sp. 10N.286.49.C2]PMH53164.1 fimbrial protein [Vibrio sp. 10N.286.49.B1]PMH84036.1 fimbrial protein [Vibrio sp. 10N.286.48.B7]
MNISTLELDEMADWPFAAQCFVAILLSLLLLCAGGYFIVKPDLDELSEHKHQELTLKLELTRMAKKAALLPLMQSQLDELNTHYDFLLEQLPEQKELASLLAAVNEEGLNNGLTFTRIDWGKRVPQDFLLKLPLDIELTGHYNSIGDYAHAIAQLPRIVLLENAEWQRVSQESSTLHFRVRAYTYQFREKSQINIPQTQRGNREQ